MSKYSLQKFSLDSFNIHMTKYLLTCYKDVDSPNTVSSFHKVPHSYEGFHFYSIQDCAPYLNRVKEIHIYCLEYNTEFGKNITPKRTSCIFHTSSSLLWKTKWRSVFLFFSAFSAGMYFTSLKVRATGLPGFQKVLSFYALSRHLGSWYITLN